MAQTPLKDQFFKDYNSLLAALLPQAAGFICYDSRGQVAWQNDALPIELTLEYTDALTSALAAPSAAGEIGRIDLGQVGAYLVPLLTDNGQVLGLLSVLLDSEVSGMSHEFCLSCLGPAIRGLQRELALRARLFDSQRKLSVQAAEEALLHQVETLVHERLSCDETLVKILRLCRHHTGIEAAAIVIPQRGVRLIDADEAHRGETGLWLEKFEVALRNDTSRPGDFICLEAYPQVQSLGISHGGREHIGLIALSGWDATDFSETRQQRLIRYIASHIESVLDANYDALTGLMRWSIFESELIDACREADSDKHSVMYLDLDQLHVINDSFGRDIGDAILADFAELISRDLNGHLATRITSDSFAALLKDTTVSDAKAIAERIGTAVNELFYENGTQTCRPTVSIGIGPLSGDPVNGNAALSTAKVACQAAKDRGRGRIEVYQSEDASIIQRFDDIQLVGQIRTAIDNDRLLLLGQPIVPLKDGIQTQYFEVLVRLLEDDGRHIPPAEFFSAAERYQMMEDIDRWVVRRTLQTIAGSDCLRGRNDIRFAINLSGQSLGNEPFLQFVEEQIAETGVGPDLLCFELTETVAVANIQRAQAFMRALKRIGCHFSLDDFGTGLSSFSYLKLFSVDTLKIDGSFIKDVTSNVVSQSVVAALSEVARVMELETVAEYVESEDALELLRNLGVTWAQGFLLGTPLPLDEQIAAMAPVATAGGTGAAATDRPVSAAADRR